VRHWITNGEAGLGDTPAATGSNDRVGNIVYGSKGYLSTARPGFKILLGKEQQPGPAPSAAEIIGPISSRPCAANRMFTRAYRAPFIVPETV